MERAKQQAGASGWTINISGEECEPRPWTWRDEVRVYTTIEDFLEQIEAETGRPASQVTEALDYLDYIQRGIVPPDRRN